MSLAADKARSARAELFARLSLATAELQPPFAVVDMDGLRANAAAMTRRALGKPIRVASKSLRCRELLSTALHTPGYHGVLAYTLPEALWLAEEHEDILVAYPSADTDALRRLAADPELARRIAVMVDCAAHVDLLAQAAREGGPELRVCLELDASLRLFGGRVHLGARRSPVHTPGQAAALAREIVTRPGLKLVGMMAYEAQVAGVGDAPPGAPLRGAAVRVAQRLSCAELAPRRALAVAAVHAVGDLEFVNGGGTGSLERTAAEPAVTELAAGSGMYGPALFDSYRSFTPRPAAFFALPVVRRPAARIATVLGGGWVASGAPARDRLPVPTFPPGLSVGAAEGAGEVQTPLFGASADSLHVGDRVWFRHAKAGELAEHVNTLHLVEGDRLVGEVPTYRGEGKAFL